MQNSKRGKFDVPLPSTLVYSTALTCGVLAAGKAMGKQRVGARQPSRLIKERGETVSFATGEIESLSRHC